MPEPYWGVGYSRDLYLLWKSEIAKININLSIGVSSMEGTKTGVK